MYLSRLTMSNFRNYTQLDVTLEPGLFVFYGDNAQGKTNLLEAVGLLATANSFHASGDREMVNWHAPDHVAHIAGTVQRHESQVTIDISLFDPTPPDFAVDTSSQQPVVALPSTTPRKRFKLNGIPKRTVDVIGQMKVVLFAPGDLHLVDGPPEERRRFLDRALCQIQPHYCQALIKYRKIVAQRSALLKRIRDNQEDARMLDYLDDQLTLFASMIVNARLRMTNSLNEHADTLQEAISGGREHLEIVYHPSFQVDEAWNESEALEHYREQLRQVRKREIQQGVCLRGPHRDDLEFLVNDANMLTYGSRGQQRTTALSVKLSELAYMRSGTGDEPLLLLDDVFSELDSHRREYLLRQIQQHEQVLLTATDLSGLQEILPQAHIYHVANGIVNKQ